MTPEYTKKLVELGKKVTEKARKANIKIKPQDVYEVVDFITELNYLLGYIEALESKNGN